MRKITGRYGVDADAIDTPFNGQGLRKAGHRRFCSRRMRGPRATGPCVCRTDVEDRAWLFGRKPVDFPWQPAGVADDGARTFVALPANAAPHAAPVLYAIEDDGSRTMVNYAVRTVAGAPVYVADRVVKRAVLVVMAGSRERKLEIENRGWGKDVAQPPAREETTRPGTRG